MPEQWPENLNSLFPFEAYDLAEAQSQARSRGPQAYVAWLRQQAHQQRERVLAEGEEAIRRMPDDPPIPQHVVDGVRANFAAAAERMERTFLDHADEVANHFRLP